MKNKSIIWIITLIAVISACITPVIAIEDDVPVPDRLISSNEKTDNSRYENIYELLSYLNIITEGLDSLKIDKTVTKGEAAEFAARIQIGDVARAAQKPFEDVELSHKNADGISAAKSNGILDNTDKFYPNRAVTNEEISKWFVRAIGNEGLVSDGNYYNTAHKLGLFSSVKSAKENTPTLAELFIIIENTMNSYVMDFEYVNEANINISIDKDLSYLFEKHEINLQKGIVTAVDYAATDKNKTQNGYIKINGQGYMTLNNISVDMVGKAVFAYVDLSDSRNRIITMWENDKANNIYDIEADEISSIERDKISYDDENGKTKTLKTELSATVLYNDVYYGSTEKAYINELYDDCGEIILIDNNADDIIDVIKLYKTEDRIVKLASQAAGKIVFKYDAPMIELDKNDQIVKIYDNGQSVGVEALTENDVCTVMQAVATDNTAIIIITVSHKNVTGILKTTGTNSSGKKIYKIDKNEYILSKTYENFLKYDKTEEKPKVGISCIFYLSAKGEIVGVKILGTYTYAYLQRISYDEDTETAFIRAYTLDGEFKKINLNDKVKLFTEDEQNGIKKDAHDIYEELKNINSVIAYKTNNDASKITEIALPIDKTAVKIPEKTSYPLTKGYTCGNATTDIESNRLYTGLINTVYGVNGVKTLTYPIAKENKSSDKNYKVSSSLPSGYGTDYYFKKELVTLYNIDEFYVPAFATIGLNDVSSDGIDCFNTPVMIASIEDTINEDDEAIKVLKYYSNGALISKSFSDDAEWFSSLSSYEWFGADGGINDLSVGDIVQFETNSSGEIKTIRRLFNYSNAGEYRVQGGGNKGAQEIKKENVMEGIALVYGVVSDKKDSYLNVNIQNDGETTKNIIPNYISSLYGRVSYTIINTRGKRVENATAENILPGDRVVLRKRYNTVCDVFIIR